MKMSLKLSTLVPYVEQYAYSTNVERLLINHLGETLFHLNPVSTCQKTCEHLLKKPTLSAACQQAHLYGAAQSERFGGKYVFYCPLGLVHWASPIIQKGKMVGALLAGHVHMVEPDDLFMEELIKTGDFPHQRKYFRQ